MIRRWAISALILAGLIQACACTGPLAPLGKASAAVISQCMLGGQVQPDETIAACTAVIAASAPFATLRARAYNLRGEAYCATAQHDRAISDQTQAIRLRPDF